jgi:RNA polymerase sigma-70 factor, ECF subfamily
MGDGDGQQPRDDRQLLEETAQWLGGDSPALSRALPEVYAELRRLAGGYLRHERPNHTLQPTALVHEAYLRLRGQRNVDWGNRTQFIGVAAKMMRRILLDHATAGHAAKRGGDAVHVSIDSALQVCERREISAVRLNEALQHLEAIDPRQAEVVELRFFGGLSVPEISELLSISPATVKREWQIAKHWLARELTAA